MSALDDSSDDVEEINEYECVEGSLEISGDWLAEVDLPNLVAVGADVSINSTPLEVVKMEKLSFVGIDLSIHYNEVLKEVEMPILLYYDPCGPRRGSFTWKLEASRQGGNSERALIMPMSFLVEAIIRPINLLTVGIQPEVV